LLNPKIYANLNLVRIIIAVKEWDYIMDMRLKNGTGSVYKLSGKRRNPYIVRKL
jgi:hypothetical protein